MTAIAEVGYYTVFGSDEDDNATDLVCLFLLPPVKYPLNRFILFLQYSWAWQYCSEFGFYQAADPNNPVNIETIYDTLASEQAWCDGVLSNMNPRQPNVTTVNKYGGWNMGPSNVFFSNGECESDDQSLSLTTFSE